VTVEGGPCTAEGQKTAQFVFGNEGYASPDWGTQGLVDIPTVPVDAAGNVNFEFEIPDELEPAQGQGGGRVIPGRYAFLSKPPICFATFTVTDS
jgi:hypothetical protein